MPMTVSWDTPERKTLLLWTIEGDWDWQEIFTCADTINTMMDSIEHSAALMIDWTRSGEVPPNALSQAHALIARRFHPRVRMVVMVGIPARFRTLWGAFSKLYETLVRSHHFHTVATLDEARALVIRQFEAGG